MARVGCFAGPALQFPDTRPEQLQFVDKLGFRLFGIVHEFQRPGCEWWEKQHPSRRHSGDFNAAFLDGHAETVNFEEYYDIGPLSTSFKYWWPFW